MRRFQILLLFVAINSCIGETNQCKKIIEQSNFNATRFKGDWYLWAISRNDNASDLRCALVKINTDTQAGLINLEAYYQNGDRTVDIAREAWSTQGSGRIYRYKLIPQTYLKLLSEKQSLSQRKQLIEEIRNYIVVETGLDWNRKEITVKRKLIGMYGSQSHVYWYTDYERFHCAVACYGNDKSTIWISTRSPLRMTRELFLEIKVLLLMHNIPISGEVVELDCNYEK